MSTRFIAGIFFLCAAVAITPVNLRAQTVSTAAEPPLWPTIGFSATSDLSTVDTAGHPVLGTARTLLAVEAELPLDRVPWLRGAVSRVQFYAKVGGDGAERAGDLQGFSNIDAPSFARFGEIYIEREFGSRLRIKAGRLDANSDFARLESASDFLNSALGFSPTIFMFPTYPLPRPGLVAGIAPTRALTVTGGLFVPADGGCEQLSPRRPHTFAVAELRGAWSIGGHAGSARLGMWRHTGHLRIAEPSSQPDAFVTIEQELWRGPDGRGITLFGQLGTADGVSGSIDRHRSGGVMWRGPFARRPDDAAGIALTGAHAGHTIGDTTETTTAVFYKYQWTTWLAVQPDVQYIARPAGVSWRASVIAATIRVQLER